VIHVATLSLFILHIGGEAAGLSHPRLLDGDKADSAAAEELVGSLLTVLPVRSRF